MVSNKTPARPTAEKPRTKTTPIPPMVESEQQHNDNDDYDDDDDDDADANSSDEDDEDDRLTSTHTHSPLTSFKLPNSKDDAIVRARLAKLHESKSSSSSSSTATATTTTTTPAVLYIGRLPKGLYEKQLQSYLSQFGTVTRLRVSRNKKTAASKHYAFVEFANQNVANIVEQTMHNYLIDGKLLQVKLMPSEQLHPHLWLGANRKFHKVPGDRIERVIRTTPKSAEQQQISYDRVLNRQNKRKRRLAQLGFEYEFDGYTIEQPLTLSNKPKKNT